MLGKADFVNLLSERCNVSKKNATEMYDNVFGVLSEVVSEGNEVAIPNLGRVKIVERAERIARNPRTNEVVKVSAKKAPKFQFAKCVKEAVASL